MRVLLAGGGTGGHIYPALAIARGILDRYPEAEILFVGTEKGLEKQIVPREGFKLATIRVEGLPRSLTLRAWTTLVQLLRGLGDSRKVLREFKPDIVIGTGGYVCGPVVFMAARKRIPTLIHEQNAFPGITNKLLSRSASRVMVTFPESIKYFPRKDRITVTGLPVRPVVLGVSREEGLARLGFDPAQKTLLVFGGSRGARSINKAMVEVIRRYAGKGIQVLHITGQQDHQRALAELAEAGIELEKNGNIKIEPYRYDMEYALAAADLVVCRAGAVTLAELTARGLPSILIPYPFAAENHQEFNAQALVKAGAAEMLHDKELTGRSLYLAIDNILTDEVGILRMAKSSRELGRPEALEAILDCLKEVLPKS